MLRRHWPGYLRGLHEGAALRRTLNATDDLDATLEHFERFEAQLGERHAERSGT
jgi:tRNA-dihydrouridine synthase